MVRIDRWEARGWQSRKEMRDRAAAELAGECFGATDEPGDRLIWCHAARRTEG